MVTDCGFIVNFTPDGRTASKDDTLEYEQDKRLGNIESMILHVTTIIDRLQVKQKHKIREGHQKAEE